MQGISLVISPIRDHAFFKQPEFQGLLSNDLFQLTRFLAKGFHLPRGSRTGRITGKPTLAGLKELLRPFIIDALGDALAPAQLSDALFATKTFKYNAYLLFCRILATCLAPDVPNNPFGRSLLILPP